MPRVYSSTMPSTANTGSVLIMKDASIPEEELELRYTQGRDPVVKVSVTADPPDSTTASQPRFTGPSALTLLSGLNVFFVCCGRTCFVVP